MNKTFNDREKIKRYLRTEMKKLCTEEYPKRKDRYPFFFCWGQAKFDVLMDIDIALKLNAFVR